MNHIKFLNLEIAGKPAASLHHLQHAFPRAEGLPEFLSTCPDCLACKPWVLMHAEPSPFSFLSSRVGKILFFFPSYMHMFGEMYLFLFFFFWLYLDASEMSHSWSLCRRPGLELVWGIILLSSSMRPVCLQEASGHTSLVIFQSFRHLWCLSLPCFLPRQPNVASWGLKCFSLMKAFLFKYRGEIKEFV